MILGHQQLVRDFTRLVKSGRLAHGYAFFGEPEVGKFYFAKHLAHLVEQGEFEMDDRPAQDGTRLAQAALGRPLQDAMILADASGIDAMREIGSFLWQKPNISTKRTVIINDAENLTDQAQNAILKIAEEPPEHALIILIVHQPENILPPLLSRLQKVHFGRLTDSEMDTVTSDKKILSLAFGRPGRAVRLASDQLTRDADQYAQLFMKSSGPARSKLIKELVDAQKDLAEDSGRKSELTDRFFESLILELRKDPVKNNVVLREVLHRLFLIKSYTTNKRLQLEAVSESALQMRTSE